MPTAVPMSTEIKSRAANRMGDPTMGVRDTLIDLVDGGGHLRGKLPDRLRFITETDGVLSTPDDLPYVLDGVVRDLEDQDLGGRGTILMMKARNVLGDAIGKEVREPGDARRARELLSSDSRGGKFSAREWRRVFNDDPMMLEAWRAGLLDDLSDRIVDGRLSRDAWRRWYDAHRDGLASFPETERELATGPKRAEALRGRARQRTSEAQFDENQALSKAILGSTFQGKKGFPKTDASRALEIVNLISHDPKAMRAAKRAVWDKGTFNLDGPAAFEKYINDRKGVLTMFLGRQHVNDLTSVARRSAEAGLKAGGSPNGLPMPHYASGGRVPMMPMVRGPFGAGHLDTLMSDALHDPNIARAMAANDERTLASHLVKIGRILPQCGED